MSDESGRKAIIYARVSDLKQVAEGHGLDSQIAICQDFAKRKGYDVVEHFMDNVSGGLTRRTGIDEALVFLRKHRKDHPIIIIDDINRLARDLSGHWELRKQIEKAGGTPAIWKPRPTPRLTRIEGTIRLATAR